MLFYGGKISEEVGVATVRSVECGVEVKNRPQQIYVSKNIFETNLRSIFLNCIALFKRACNLAFQKYYK